MESQAQHPYVPRDLNQPDFVGNFLSPLTIFSTYSLAAFLIIIIIWLISGFSRKLAKINRLLICWFVFTGLNYIVLVGYYLFSPEFYKEKTPFLLAELWKEYSKGDSRYASRDTTIVAVDILLVFLVSPACIVSGYAIAAGKSYSYLLQFATSLCHLYGSALYFLRPYLDGINYSSSPFYYYAYCIGSNSPWIVVPILVCIRSWKKICSASQEQGPKKTKGH